MDCSLKLWAAENPFHLKLLLLRCLVIAKGEDTKRSLYKNYKIATLDAWLFLYIYSAFKAELDVFKEKLEHSDPEGYV